jgi:uncharacterized membrane protein YkoI
MRSLICTLLVLLSTAALADGGRDHEWLEEARERGDVLPLTELLERLKLDGTVLEIEVEDEDGRIAYEIYYLDAAGRRHEVLVDAATGEVLESKEKD